MHESIISKWSSVTVGFLVRNGFGMPEHATEILSDSDHHTKVQSTNISDFLTMTNSTIFDL